ncbi:MAG: DUF1501 domain-containing protein [Planctomycetota bacterium]
MADCNQYESIASRRDFLGRLAMGVGATAFASLAERDARASAGTLPTGGHFPARAKRVIYLFQSGAPSQIDLFDDKPRLRELNGEELPASVRDGQRLTGMTAGQVSFPLAGSHFKFARHGESGIELSDLLPHTAKIADKLCVVRSLYTEAINHDPAAMFFQTGSQLPGRPSIGSWVDYGLGSENDNLPAFVVLVTKDKKGQPLYARLWGSGFLPSQHQGVQFRAGADAVLYLSDPDGIDREVRSTQLEALRQLQTGRHEELGDAEILARLSQYEMAFKMQTAVPDVTDTSDETEETFELYGPDAKSPGTFAANCLLARRMVERGVRFVQLYHQGWDHHGGLPGEIRKQCRDTDQASAALVMDLERRGLLDDTLVVWGGEFGRTSYSQGQLTATTYGRDHHPRCFSLWMAGGGVKAGYTHGATDDFSYNVTADPVHVHDFQATLMHLMGVDHERLTYRFQGRRFRLTDVHGAVVHHICWHSGSSGVFDFGQVLNA